MTPRIETEGPGTDVTRRTLLRAGAGAAGALAVTGLPAWARPVTDAVTGLRRPDSRPFPHLPAGHVSMPEIRHIVVLMMENHSFDNLLGMVPYQVKGRAGVDGLRRHRGRLLDFNRDTHGKKVFAQHAGTPCQLPHVPTQAWNASHQSYDGGRNDGFVRASGPVAMRFWDKGDLPFTYSLVEHFPIGERFFCSTLCQTYPNRRFFFAGTASGLVSTDITASLHLTAANGTIFDRFDAHKIDHRIYYQQVPSWLIIPGVLAPPGRGARQHKFDQFLTDAAAGTLPAVLLHRPELRHDVGGKPAGHPGRRAVHRSGHERRPAFARVEAHGAVHHLRRARRLLRPRPAAARDQAGQHQADPQSR